MYKHANDEVPLKVSCKKYLEKVSLRYYLYLVSSRYFFQYLHLVSSRYFLKVSCTTLISMNQLID